MRQKSQRYGIHLLLPILGILTLLPVLVLASHVAQVIQAMVAESGFDMKIEVL